eukprot:scaffold66834_cov44-Prasinocladus_malaysianus.AAC.2
MLSSGEQGGQRQDNRRQDKTRWTITIRPIRVDTKLKYAPINVPNSKSRQAMAAWLAYKCREGFGCCIRNATSHPWMGFSCTSLSAFIDICCRAVSKVGIRQA